MTTPFSNPIVGAQGTLVRKAIKSPNFALSPLTGWSIDQNGNAFFGNVVISGTFGGSFFELTTAGFFLYSSTPAAGNLIASIASAAGVDGFGNAYRAGISAYGASGLITAYGSGAFAGAFAQLVQNSLELADSTGATSGIAAIVIGGIHYLEIFRGSADPLYIAAPGVPTDVATIVANEPAVAGTPEVWHTLALNAGFAALAGFAAPRYRFEPVGSGGQVRLAGALSLTANQVIGAAFATMPAAYRPSFSQYFLTASSLAGGVGTQTETVRVINATGGGALELGNSGNTGNYVLLEGITYVMD